MQICYVEAPVYQTDMNATHYQDCFYLTFLISSCFRAAVSDTFLFRKKKSMKRPYILTVIAVIECKISLKRGSCHGGGYPPPYLLQ